MTGQSSAHDRENRKENPADGWYAKRGDGEHMPRTRISSQSPTASDLTPRCQLQWRLACFGLAITALFLTGLPTKGAQAAIGTANSAASLGELPGWPASPRV